MYYKSYYVKLSEEEIKKKICKEGFDPQLFHDKPGFVYTPHHHKETKLLGFLSGSMEVTVGTKKILCGPTDKLIIPGNIVHSAVVGSEGCTFFWSEKIL